MKNHDRVGLTKSKNQREKSLTVACPKFFRNVGLACLLAASLFVHPAASQGVGCDGFAWSVAAERQRFMDADLPALKSGASTPSPETVAFQLKLEPQDKVAFALPPERKPKDEKSSAGFVALGTPAHAGMYQVTLSDEAWIDVIQGGRALASTSHSGRRDCKDVRKSVRFELQERPAVLQLSGVSARTIKVMISPVS